MNLSDLLENPSLPPLSVRGLSSDSRETYPGDLFIACAGPKAERAHFISQAVQKGAVAVLQNTEQTSLSFKIHEIAGKQIPVCSIPHLSEQVGMIAAKFYGFPAKSLTCIGITGTNGKTSCTLFVARVIENLRRDGGHLKVGGHAEIALPTLPNRPRSQGHCGIIGTLGSGFPDHIVPGTLTTPGAIELQKTIADLKAQHATHLAMEVSSHSLVQHRVAGIPFKIAVFTNLTRDHLDYHGDMKSYGQAKRMLFLTPGLQYAVINADDAFGRELLSEFASQFECYAYTLENHTTHSKTIYADNLQLHPQGFSAHIYSPWGSGELHSKLLGRFNVSNLLAALTTLCLLGLPFEQILKALAKLPTAPGRMQCFGGGDKPVVVIDYAHTPDALEKALTALREHTTGKLWCVFGCGGNRDTGKRPLMGNIAATHSDHVIITNDNPRLEDPHQIIEEILAGITKTTKLEAPTEPRPQSSEPRPQGSVASANKTKQASCKSNTAILNQNVANDRIPTKVSRQSNYANSISLEPDRKLAILSAIKQAQPGDMILVAGKGHEMYQRIGEVMMPFSDIEVVQEILEKN